MAARLKYFLVLSFIMMPVMLPSAEPSQEPSDSPVHGATYFTFASPHGSTRGGTGAAVVGPSAPTDLLGAHVLEISNESVDQPHVKGVSRSDDDSFSLLDAALMFLFSAGMLAYPLVRKQRALLDTSVSP